MSKENEMYQIIEEQVTNDVMKSVCKFHKPKLLNNCLQKPIKYFCKVLKNS